MMAEESIGLLIDLPAWCRTRLREMLAVQGFFPTSHQLLFLRDPGFTWKRRMRVYETTPHLRWELLATSIIHLIRGRSSDKRGQAREISSQAFFSGDASTFYFNALISDCLELAREGTAQDTWEADWETQAVREYETDSLVYRQDRATVPAWAYFPQRTHRFKQGNVIHRLMHAWGALAADLDTTSMVLCRLLAVDSPIASIPDILTLLEDHVYGAGRHGMEKLAYENGSVGEDRGVLLWVHEKHNELDAGVNLNVLCLLIALAEKGSQEERERAFALAAQALAFLDRHIGLGSYARSGFLMFYSLEAMAFLWHRFAARLEAMPGVLRTRFDNRDVCSRLGRHLAGLLEPRLASANAFDTLLALPLLLRTGSPAAAGPVTPESLRRLAETASARAYEFGRFTYPLTFLYGNRALGPCAALMCDLELRRGGRVPSNRHAT